MNNMFDEIRRAIDNAEHMLRVVNNQSNDLADLLTGRLRHVSVYRLKKLKRELQQFDANRGAWKS